MKEKTKAIIGLFIALGLIVILGTYVCSVIFRGLF